MDLNNLEAIDPRWVFEEGDSFFCSGKMRKALYKNFPDVRVEPFIATAATPQKSYLNTDVFKVTIGKHKAWRHRAPNIFKQVGVGQGWIFSCGSNEGEIKKAVPGILQNIIQLSRIRVARQQVTLANISTGEVVQGYYVHVVSVIDVGEQP